MILLSFSGFLRYDEVSSLRFNYVKAHDNHLVLHLEKSKTDQYRQSSDVLIAKGSAVACRIWRNGFLFLGGFYSYTFGCFQNGRYKSVCSWVW
jgi:hypothetical protein